MSLQSTLLRIGGKKRSFIPLAATLGSLLLGCGAKVIAAECSSLTEDAKHTIAKYVQKKYKIPGTDPVTIVAAEFVEGTCYQKLHLRNTDVRRNFSTTLYLSPDHRFLSSDVLDINSDPLEEERKRLEQFRIALNKPSAPALGSSEAPVTLVVFSDFQCPYCKTAADVITHEVFPLEEKNLRVIFRHFPLSIHPWAQPAAEAAACARRQSNDAFWSFHDYLFAHQTELTAENINRKMRDHAKSQQKFNVPQYESCTTQHESKAEVQEDLDFALENKVAGTPTMFINGRRMEWSGAAEQVRSLIRQLLREKEQRAAIQ